MHVSSTSCRARWNRPQPHLHDVLQLALCCVEAVQHIVLTQRIHPLATRRRSQRAEVCNSSSTSSTSSASAHERARCMTRATAAERSSAEVQLALHSSTGCSYGTLQYMLQPPGVGSLQKLQELRGQLPPQHTGWGPAAGYWAQLECNMLNRYDLCSHATCTACSKAIRSLSDADSAVLAAVHNCVSC